MADAADAALLAVAVIRRPTARSPDGAEALPIQHPFARAGREVLTPTAIRTRAPGVAGRNQFGSLTREVRSAGVVALGKAASCLAPEPKTGAGDFIRPREEG